MEAQLKEYRSHLISAEQKAQEHFDKTVLSLSSGALGISFAFFRDIVGEGPMLSFAYLMSAWICWGGSIVFILLSFLTSLSALRRAIKQVDKGKIYEQKVGGVFSRFTEVFNALGAILFLIGIVLIITFVWNNLEVKMENNQKLDHNQESIVPLEGKKKKGYVPPPPPPESKPPQPNVGYVPPPPPPKKDE